MSRSLYHPQDLGTLRAAAAELVECQKTATIALEQAVVSGDLEIVQDILKQAE